MAVKYLKERDTELKCKMMYSDLLLKKFGILMPESTLVKFQMLSAVNLQLRN